MIDSQRHSPLNFRSARRWSRFIIALSLSISTLAAHAAIPGLVLQSLKGEYDDVKERVVMAIEARGLVIDHTAHVGAMLERTGKDIGRAHQIYLKAEVMEFCSAAV